MEIRCDDAGIINYYLFIYYYLAPHGISLRPRTAMQMFSNFIIITEIGKRYILYATSCNFILSFIHYPLNWRFRTSDHFTSVEQKQTMSEPQKLIYGGSGGSLASLSKVDQEVHPDLSTIPSFSAMSYPRPHVISTCHNSKLVSTFVSSSRSRVFRHVAVRSNCLTLR